MTKFNWLHLTDLHLGMAGQSHLWPNVRKAFFDDLKVLHDTCGRFHAVFFTGDFVQKGARGEYEKLDVELKKIWDDFDKLGSQPALFIVPGNHDLTRPKENAATRVLTRLWDDPEVQQEFWEDEASEYRSLIIDAFQEYKQWSDNCPYRQPSAKTGILPGDFSSTLEVDGLKIGIVGLNTTFLQLTKGDYLGKLAVDSRQLHEVCDEDAPRWVDAHQVCFLLTHQGPDWLNDDSKNRSYAESNPAGRFDLHLYGHMHEHEGQSFGLIGGDARRTWQGCSLFGLEFIDDEKKEERRHGYSAGQIEVDGESGKLRLWPRVGNRLKDGNWWIAPDTQAGKLEGDNGTTPVPIVIRAASLAEPIDEIELPSEEEAAERPELRLWREQLFMYRQELAKAVDPAQRLNLRRLIDELQKKISGQ
ncbi:MAG: metallophosphoesterase [Candidatus Paceibacterota bacterium]